MQMLRALRGVASELLTAGLSKNVIETIPRRMLSTEKVVEAAEEKTEPIEEESVMEKRVSHQYSNQSIQKLKLDQYPLYVEREWWKTGKRMTFWATWRQLRDVKRREKIQETGADRMRQKAIKFNTILPQAIRDEAAEKMSKADRKEHPRLVLNMCQFTGRQRGKIKPYRLSRHLFRRFADRSALSGVQRAMW